jgi:4-amino-4-deoxy-L-arabinose transferase-like glycosyltransferase
VFFSTDPTLLGHGAWVTTDVAACAGYLAATYHGIRFIARPTLLRATFAGLAVGLALACKFSCALVLPALVLIWLMRGRRARRTARRVIPLGAAALVAATLTLWATYAFDVGRIADLNLTESYVLEGLPAWLATTPIPMPTAVVGYLVLSHHNAMGHFAYLNGEVSQAGWWYYFPEAIAIKSPVALLVALVVALILMIIAPRRSHGRSMVLVIPCAVFLLASTSAGINIGIRHVLPAIPFLYLFASLWLARGRFIVIALALIVAAVVETALVHPDYLAFFNLLVGGPDNGEKYLLDSNLDWGQDQARLHDWLQANARGRVVTARIFGNPRLYEWPRESFTLLPDGASPQGVFAISKNYLYDVYPNPGGARFRGMNPVARIGYSINVYDLDAEEKRGHQR